MTKRHESFFDRQTEEAYGVLGKDNDTILPLDDDNLQWIEGNGFYACYRSLFQKINLENIGYNIMDNQVTISNTESYLTTLGKVFLIFFEINY